MISSKTSLKKAILWTVNIIMILFITYLLIAGFLKQRSLKIHKEEAIAIICGFTSIRYTDHLEYEFILDKKLYKGSGYYYKKIDRVAIGDSICIVYDKTNPNNNKSCRDFYR